MKEQSKISETIINAHKDIRGVAEKMNTKDTELDENAVLFIGVTPNDNEKSTRPHLSVATIGSSKNLIGAIAETMYIGGRPIVEMFKEAIRLYEHAKEHIAKDNEAGIDTLIKGALDSKN